MQPGVHEHVGQRAGTNLQSFGLALECGMVSLVEADGDGLGLVPSLARRCVTMRFALPRPPARASAPYRGIHFTPNMSILWTVRAAVVAHASERGLRMSYAEPPCRGGVSCSVRVGAHDANVLDDDAQVVV